MARAATAPRQAAARPSLGHAVGYEARPPGRARPRTGRPAVPREPGARARRVKSTSVPPPTAANRLTHVRGYESVVSHVTRRKGGARRKPTRALWVRVFRARGLGFRGWPSVRPRLRASTASQRHRPVLSTDLQSHFFTTRCVEWNGAPMATLDLPPARSISAPRTGSGSCGWLCGVTKDGGLRGPF